MSLGQQQNQDNNKPFSPQIYSEYKFNNFDSTVDKTALLPTFKSNRLLNISITPMVQDSAGNITYDHKNKVDINLTHTKARMFYDEICRFQEDGSSNREYGVNSAQGLISISNGLQFGINSPCIVIRKLNADNGSIESSAAYQVRTGFHYSIRNFDEQNLSFDKVYYDDLEVEQIKTLLLSYYEIMTGATQFAVANTLQYDNNKVNNKLDSICDKLGVVYESKSTNNKSSSSFFDSKEANNYKNKSLSDIESQIG